MKKINTLKKITPLLLLAILFLINACIDQECPPNPDSLTLTNQSELTGNNIELSYSWPSVPGASDGYQYEIQVNGNVVVSDTTIDTFATHILNPIEAGDTIIKTVKSICKFPSTDSGTSDTLIIDDSIASVEVIYPKTEILTICGKIECNYVQISSILDSLCTLNVATMKPPIRDSIFSKVEFCANYIKDCSYPKKFKIGLNKLDRYTLTDTTHCSSDPLF